MVKEDKIELVDEELNFPQDARDYVPTNQSNETISFELASFKRPTGDVVNGPEEIPPGFGQYDDFHTIDWQRDMARDRLRHKQLARRQRFGTMFDRLKGIQDASSGWICVLFVACLAGMCAAMIDIGSLWMFDLKLGVCVEQFWFNKEHCCWMSNESTFGMHDCGEWQPWSSMFGMKYTDAGVAVHPIAAYVVDYFVYVALALVVAAMAAMYVRVFAPYASGGGIAEIKCILSGFIIRGFLGKWTLLVKTVGLMLSTSTGLNLGKEGPMVHVACCCGNVLAYFFPKYGKNEAKKREILSASAAAGISVAFGTPIGGILFSLEEVSYYFPLKTLWRSFFCALVAAFVLRWFNPFGNDHMGVFYIDYSVPWYLLELIPFILLGALGGAWGAMFIRANMRWCRFRKMSNLGKYPIAEVLIVTLINCVLAYPNPYTRISLTDLIRMLVMQCGPEDDVPLCDYQWDYMWGNATSADLHQSAPLGPGVIDALWQLSLALIFRIVIFVFTVGIKIPAGTFIPSMAIGAIIGRLIGIGVEQFAFNHRNDAIFYEMCNSGHPCVTPGIYAMVGAAACLGGVTRMTVSLVVIMFEVTGGLQYIVPLMAAVMTSKWVGDAFGKEGLADAQIRLNGFPFLDNKEECLLDTLASDVIRSKKDKLSYLTQDSMTVEDVEHMLLNTTHNGYPVVVSKEKPRLIGYGWRRDILLAIDSARKYNSNIVSKSPVLLNSNSVVCSSDARFEPLCLWKLIDVGPTTVIDETPMEVVVDMFRKLGLRQILVTCQGDLVGVITKKDVLKHLAERQHKDPNSIMFD